MIALLWLACRPDPEPSRPEPTPPAPTTSTPTPTPPDHLGDARLLARLSLDLRGVRPTISELDSFEDDPDVDRAIDGMVADPRLGQRVADLWSEVFALRAAPFFVYFDWMVQDTGLSADTLAGHAAEEPLQVLAWITDHDLPLDELVTADWTVADEVTAQIFPVDYPPGAAGFQRAHYTDGRPAVGILASNGWWWHQGSMENNRNRGRANEVSRVLLCDDFLEREIPFSDAGGLASEEGQADAIRSDPACVSCHESLDPLASHFYGFWWYTNEKVVPELISTYRGEREDLWRELTGTAPGYFGEPTGGLHDLGERVADDPRFARCFVSRTWEQLTRTDLDDVPADLEPVHAAFAERHNVRDALRSLVALPEYQGADPAFAVRRMSPELLSSAVEDLTGYRWSTPESDRDLVTAQTGYVVLAGGADRERVATAATTETVTTVLVQQRLAESASQFAVRADHRLEPQQRRLLGDIDFTERADGPGHERMERQARSLRRRILGERATDGDVARDLELWADAFELTGDVDLAWALLVSVHLRDPAFVTY